MKKSKKPAHQNLFAFKHNKNSRLTKKIAEEPLDVLCKRCYGKLTWRKQFRKYKMLTVPGRCNACQEKNIVKAYRTICDPCALQANLCAKCFKEPICSDPEELLKSKQNPDTSDEEIEGLEELKKE
jgi:Uncharacterized conserved protein (DUF2039)